jgi:hypothetical protein
MRSLQVPMAKDFGLLGKMVGFFDISKMITDGK